MSVSLSIKHSDSTDAHIAIQIPRGTNLPGEQWALIQQLTSLTSTPSFSHVSTAGSINNDYVSSTSAKRNKVKRPMNSFLVFSNQTRPILQAENKDLNNAQISKLLGTKWQMMSDEDRASYVETATKIRAEFSAAHPDYVYTKTPRKHKKRKIATEQDLIKAEQDEQADIRKRLAASCTAAAAPAPAPTPAPAASPAHSPRNALFKTEPDATEPEPDAMPLLSTACPAHEFFTQHELQLSTVASPAPAEPLHDQVQTQAPASPLCHPLVHSNDEALFAGALLPPLLDAELPSPPLDIAHLFDFQML